MTDSHLKLWMVAAYLGLHKHEYFIVMLHACEYLLEVHKLLPVAFSLKSHDCLLKTCTVRRVSTFNQVCEHEHFRHENDVGCCMANKVDCVSLIQRTDLAVDDFEREKHY